jgi:hypothetical protein
VFTALSARVPVPAFVIPKVAPLTTPLTVKLLAESFVQVWFPPKATFEAMVLAGTSASIVMPVVLLAGVIVRVLPSALSPRPLEVSEIVKVLIVMFAPSVVAVGATVGLVAEMITSAPAPGTSA